MTSNLSETKAARNHPHLREGGPLSVSVGQVNHQRWHFAQ
jgi:hypothetical protein